MAFPSGFTRRAIGFDFDDCLLNELFSGLQSTDTNSNNVIKANLPLLKRIKQENETNKIQSLELFILSARQSKGVDQANHYCGHPKHTFVERGSCFSAMAKIALYLKGDHAGFLMADVYSKLSAGESYRKAVDSLGKSNSQVQHGGWAFDKTKASIIYAHVHRLAKKYPYDKIIYDGFDDNPMILASLNKFFGQDPDLIPSNVALRLNRYNGLDDNGNYDHEGYYDEGEVIQGTGFIDPDYRQGVIDLVTLSHGIREDELRLDDHYYDVANAFSGEGIHVFKRNSLQRRQDSLRREVQDVSADTEQDFPMPVFAENALEDASISAVSQKTAEITTTTQPLVDSNVTAAGSSSSVAEKPSFFTASRILQRRQAKKEMAAAQESLPVSTAGQPTAVDSLSQIGLPLDDMKSANSFK